MGLQPVHQNTYTAEHVAGIYFEVCVAHLIWAHSNQRRPLSNNDSPVPLFCTIPILVGQYLTDLLYTTTEGHTAVLLYFHGIRQGHTKSKVKMK